MLLNLKYSDLKYSIPINNIKKSLGLTISAKLVKFFNKRKYYKNNCENKYDDNKKYRG